MSFIFAGCFHKSLSSWSSAIHLVAVNKVSLYLKYVSHAFWKVVIDSKILTIGLNIFETCKFLQFQLKLFLFLVFWKRRKVIRTQNFSSIHLVLRNHWKCNCDKCESGSNNAIPYYLRAFVWRHKNKITINYINGSFC